MDSLNKKIGIGALWSFLELFLSKSASTIFTIFLATLLTPKDFGLIAVIAVVFELSHVLVNAGFTQALIRSKEVSHGELSTAFWGNLAIASFMYLVVFLFSGQIAAFFNEPVLELMVQVLGVGIFVNAFRIVQTAILSRRIDFRSQMTATTIGVVVSGLVAIFLAYQGFGVWSLVGQMLTSQIVSTAILWFSTKWMPKLIFERQAFKQLFDFGKYLVIANVFNVAFKNSYALVIAKVFSPEMTGLYYFATKVSSLASQQLTDALQKSSFPALATFQDDNKKLRYKYREIIQISMFVISPIMFLLMALADPVFELLFDERWGDAVTYTQLLCIVGILYPIHSLNVNVLMVTGRSDLNLKLGLIKKGIQITLLAASVPFGVFGIVIGQIIGSVIALVPNSYYTAKLIAYGGKAQFSDIVRPILAGGIAASSAWLTLKVQPPSLIVLLLLAGCVGVIVYLAVSILIRAEGAMLLIGKVKKYVGARFSAN